MPSTTRQRFKENAPISTPPARKNRGRRSREHASNPDHRSRHWDKSSECEPLLATPRSSLTSEEPSQNTQGADFLAAECFATPVKRRRNITAGSPQDDAPSPMAGRSPFRPLDAISNSNSSRPTFLSPLYSPRKPRNTLLAKPARAMMDVFLDSRARSDVEDESDSEPVRDIARRLRIGKQMRTPESPTPPSSRASSREGDSIFSTPTRSSNYSSSVRSPDNSSRFYLWGGQESPSPTTAPGASRSRAPSTHHDGFWRKEAERLRMCAPKVLLPSWHLGLIDRRGGEDTERLMTLAEVSFAELEMGRAGLDAPEHRGFEVSDDRSTTNWS